MAGTEKRYKGLTISGGKAVARVCLFNEGRHSNMPLYKVKDEGVALEKARLERALAIVDERLEALTKSVAERIGQAEAEIFATQKVIMEDPGLRSDLFGRLESQQCNAETAVALTLDGYETRLAEVDHDYISERASDIGELKRRMLDALRNMNPSFQCAGEEHCQHGRDRVVVAKELTPSLTVELDAGYTKGFVTERGGYTSHAGILARALGIPAVSGIEGIHGMISCGTEVLVDGDAGEIVVWPSEETLARYSGLRAASASKSEAAVRPAPGFCVMANISLINDLKDAVAEQAEGIGLYRTEFEFFATRRILSEEEQVDRYATVLKAMEGKPVYFRLLDLGGDKTFPELALPREENPYLGRRGARLLLARPDLLDAQARALARASAAGPVNVIYPMIVELKQFTELRRRFLEAVRGIHAGRMTHGIMLEVPAACLAAREMLEASDFACVGTNDLIQYLFAVDRNNELVAEDYVPDRPVFWRMMGDLVKAAADAGRPLSVCGEMAGEPGYVARLMDIGIKTVSVSARLIPGVRVAAVRNRAAAGRPA